MDFSLTEEQEFFRKTVQDTVNKMIVPHAREMDEKDEFPWQLWGGILPVWVISACATPVDRRAERGQDRA